MDYFTPKGLCNDKVENANVLDCGLLRDFNESLAMTEWQTLWFLVIARH
ncbi:hypothetical protein [Helicobacter rodentium]|nr:hypothetical protein [Helicobacter rodentium]